MIGSDPKSSPSVFQDTIDKIVGQSVVGGITGERSGSSIVRLVQAYRRTDPDMVIAILMDTKCLYQCRKPGCLIFPFLQFAVGIHKQAFFGTNPYPPLAVAIENGNEYIV